MNTERPSHTDSSDRRVTNRYAQFELEAETVVIYDREQTHAWIQSDVTMSTDAATESASESDAFCERHLAAANATSPVNGGEFDG